MSSRYASVKIGGRTISAHRHIWETAHGPIPDGLVVHHRNGDRFDNRLANLELMTPAQHSAHHNNKHSRTKTCESCGRTYEPHPTKRERSKTCSRECFRALAARAVGSAKGSAKLAEDQVAEIRRRIASGEKQNALCIEFGLSPGAMSSLVNRKTWQHVP